MHPIEQLVEKIANTLEIPSATAEVARFLRCIDGQTDSGTGISTIISDTGLPFEFSFSGNEERPFIRLLAEATAPGEPLVNRCLRGIKSAAQVADEFGLGGGGDRVAEAVDALLPQGENLGELNWMAASWIGIRTDGLESYCRIYVNLQWQQWYHRYQKIYCWLEQFDLKDACKPLLELAGITSGWAVPVGVSLDLLPNQIRLARVHFNPQKMPVRRLMLLLEYAGFAKYREPVFQFLEVFPLEQYKQEKPVLLSVGFSKGIVSSVKLDVYLRLLSLTSAEVINAFHQTEQIIGVVKNYALIQALFREKWDASKLRYVGLTVSSRHAPYLNVYLAPPHLEGKQPEPKVLQLIQREASQKVQAPWLKSAHSFLCSQQHENGSLLMDARAKSSEMHRQIPPNWHDIYMTSLASQEARRLCNHISNDFTLKLVKFIATAQENGLWRYLPNLPCDVDDSAMAVVSLLEASLKVPQQLFQNLMAVRVADGGFVTFIGNANQASHPAVTLNTVYVLSKADIDWEYQATAEYLLRWIQQEDFPQCQWMYSPMFVLYLLSRTKVVHQWLGSIVSTRLLERIFTLRRSDGTWGRATPEALDTALAVLCLKSMEVEIPEAAELANVLLSFQFPDGGWCWSPLFSDGEGIWFGHRAITTIMAVRALELLQSK